MFQQNRHILISSGDSKGREHYRCIFQREQGQFFETDLFPDTLSLFGFFCAQYRVGKRIPLSLLDTDKDFSDGCRTSEALLNTDPETMIILVSDISEFSPDQRKCLRPHVYFFRKPAPSDALYSLVCTLIRNWNERLCLREKSVTSSVRKGKIIFDEQGVSERMGDNQNLIRMMMKVFVGNVPKQLQQLEEKVKNRDIEEIRRIEALLTTFSEKSRNLEEAARLIRELKTAFEQMKQTAAEKGLV